MILSGSIGKPGQWNDPEVKNALILYEKTVKKYKTCRISCHRAQL